MRRRRTIIPIPWPIQYVHITDHAVRVRSKQQEWVLTFQDERHVEEFLAAFGEAWMRWDEPEDAPTTMLDDLQRALPF